MLTDFQNRATYFGTLDDVVVRYPSHRLSHQALQHQLVTAAIYDKKILINDGYLIANPLLTNELTDVSRSLVGNLLMTGAARLFVRGGVSNLAAGVEQSAPKIDTHREIVANAERWRLMRDDLEFLSGEVRKYTVPWPKDKNLGELFYLLMARVRALSEHPKRLARLLPQARFADFESVFARFDQELEKPGFDAARSVWERCCWSVCAPQQADIKGLMRVPTAQRGLAFEGYDRVQPLMHVANEMYHVSYAMGALHALKADQRDDLDCSAIGVATALVAEFPDVLGAEDVDASEQDARKLSAVTQALISLPPNIKFSDDYIFLSRIRTHGECRRSRGAYLSQLRAFLEDRSTHEDLLETRDDYIDALARQLEPCVKRSWFEIAIGRGVDYLSKPFEGAAMVLDAAAAAGGALAQSVEFAVPIGVDHLKNRIIERLVRQRLRAGIQQMAVAAVQDPVAVPLARNLGLYVGPLKTDGAEKLLASVKPHPQFTP